MSVRDPAAGEFWLYLWPFHVYRRDVTWCCMAFGVHIFIYLSPIHLSARSGTAYQTGFSPRFRKSAKNCQIVLFCPSVKPYSVGIRWWLWHWGQFFMWIMLYAITPRIQRYHEMSQKMTCTAISSTVDGCHNPSRKDPSAEWDSNRTDTSTIRWIKQKFALSKVAKNYFARIVASCETVI